MKVDLNNVDQSTLDSVSSAQRNAPSVQSSDSEPVRGDEEAATFSGSSLSVDSLVAKALDATSLRADKIEALRQAVQNGTYQVNPSETADAMTREFNDPGLK